MHLYTRCSFLPDYGASYTVYTAQKRTGAQPKPRQVSRRTQLKVRGTRTEWRGWPDAQGQNRFVFIFFSSGSTSITGKWHDPLAFHYRPDYTGAPGYCQAISLDPLDSRLQCIHGFNPYPLPFSRTTVSFLRLTSVYLFLPPAQRRSLFPPITSFNIDDRLGDRTAYPRPWYSLFTDREDHSTRM